MVEDWRAFLKQNGYVGKVIGFRELKVVMGERKPPFSEEQLQLVEQRWVAFKEKNPSAYSRNVLAVNDISVDLQNGSVVVNSYKTEWRVYRMLNEDPGENDRVWIAGSAGLTYVVENGERIFVFGERTRNTMPVGGDVESLPSGSVEVAEKVIYENHFSSAFLREANEEIGVAEKDVFILQYLGLGRVRKWDRLYQDFHVDFLAELRGLSWGDVEATFKENVVRKMDEKKSLEHKRIIPVRESELSSFIESQNDHIGIRARLTIDSFLELGLWCGAKP